MVYCGAGIAGLQEKSLPLVSQEGYRAAHLTFTALQHQQRRPETSASDCQSTMSSDDLT